MEGPPGRDQRPVEHDVVRIWPHALVALAILALVQIWTGASGQFSVDEGAAALQASALEEGSWGIEHPLGAVDPHLTALPVRSMVRVDGGFAPYAKHPLYPSLLALASRVGGVDAMVSVSVLAAVAAGMAAAGLSQRLGGGGALWCLYGVSLGSPLVFDSQLLIAHTLGAALVGAGVIAVHDWGSGATWSRLVLAGLLFAAAVMLRTEAVLLATGLALTLLVLAAQQRRGRWAVASVAVGLGAVVGWVTDRGWRALLAVSGPSPAPSVLPTDGFLDDRLEAIGRTLLTEPGEIRPWVLAGMVLTLLAAALWRQRRHPLSAVVLWAGVGAYVVGALVAEPSPITGLLAASPVIGAAAILGPSFGSALARLLGMSTGVFAVAVIATQYRVGGGVEWGWRYVALAIPLLGPLVVSTLLNGLRAAPRSVRPALAGALGVLTATTSLMAVAELAEGTRAAQQLGRSIVKTAPPSVVGSTPDDDRPIVVTTGFAIPSLAWPIFEDVRWLRVSTPSVDARGRDERVLALLEQDVDQFTLVVEDIERIRELLGAEQAFQTREIRQVSGWFIVLIAVSART